VVLDEPEAGLDPQSRSLVREYIRALANTKTVILTTHNMDEADRLCSRVAIIDHGELLVVDTPDALARSLGEGDVVEITLNGGPGATERALEALSRFHAIPVPGGVAVRALNAIGWLPEIVQALSTHGLPCSDIRLRKNTLEDVFIQLTGRRLRE
jgi:ABC-2 type transport system ATP-binding protein